MNIRLTSNVDLRSADSAGSKPLWPILQVGSFNASIGGRVTVKSADLDELVKSYDPAVERAAINIDHEDNGPALGWVARLERRGNVLFAEVEDIDPKLRADIQAKKYRRPSVELHKKHPVTGGLYLDGLAVLGAKRAAVKGLEISLADAAEVLEFEADPIPGSSEPSTDAPVAGQQESTMSKKTSPAAGENSDQQATIQAPAVTDATVAELAERSEATLARLSEQQRSLAATERRLALKEADLEVRDALAAIGNRVTPAMKSAGLVALLVALKAAEQPTEITLSGADGKESKASAYEVALAVVKSIPDVVSPMLGGPLATGDKGALTAADGIALSEEDRAWNRAHGIDEAREKELVALYGKPSN